MKKEIFTVLILFYFSGLLSPNSTVAQNNFLSINLDHPIPVEGEFYAYFQGIGSIDINYGQPFNKFLFLSGNLSYSRSRFNEDERINLDMYQLGLGFSTFFRFGQRFELQPQLDLGYALMKFYFKTVAQENQTSPIHRIESKDLNGWQTTLSLSWNYLLTDKFSIGFSTGYEFTYIPRENIFRKYHQEMHAINLGLKTIFKL